MKTTIEKLIERIASAEPLQALSNPQRDERTPEQRRADAQLAAAWNQYFFDQNQEPSA